MTVLDNPGAIDDIPTERGGPRLEECAYCSRHLGAGHVVFWSNPRLALHPNCAGRWALALHGDAVEARILKTLREKPGGHQ